MQKLVSLSDLSRIRDVDCPYYDGVREWWDSDGETQAYHIISTSNYLVRSIEDWNTLGPEIYDYNNVSEHAFLTNQLLHALGLRQWVVQLSKPTLPWFPKRLGKELNYSRIAYMRSIAGEETFYPRRFRGGIVFDIVPTFFVNHFIDYPFVNKYQDIELLHRAKPLVMRFSHHLSVDYISSDTSLLRSIASFFDQSGLKRDEDYPSKYVNRLAVQRPG